MDINRDATSFTDKLYMAAHFVCLMAFVVPASSIAIDGQSFTQYLLTSYTGWVVLAVIVILFVIQGLVYLKISKWPGWLGFVTGLYCFSYAVITIWKGYARFSSSMEDNLVKKLEVTNTPLAGLWLLAIGGGMLVVTATIKIVHKQSGVIPG